ncbi:MAG: HD domain-containing protein [Desulfobacteraceae bacterium]|nr:HD domain-containing protein [Desulfobacteraceae bacterium]
MYRKEEFHSNTLDIHGTAHRQPGRSARSEDPVLHHLKSFARKVFKNARGSHDWDHTRRVAGLCERIGAAEGADMFILMGAAYLHDIGRCEQDAARGSLCHAESGAAKAKPFVNDLPISDRQKENILHCITSHRFRGKATPQTIEAKVLFDADKLDAIGAIGVARAYLFAGELGARLHNPDMDVHEARSYSRNDTGYREYVVKLCKIKDRMLTVSGLRMAQERHEYMVQFFNRFLDEYEAKR